MVIYRRCLEGDEEVRDVPFNNPDCAKTACDHCAWDGQNCMYILMVLEAVE